MKGSAIYSLSRDAKMTFFLRLEWSHLLISKGALVSGLVIPEIGEEQS
jgi:hypothetical protein